MVFQVHHQLEELARPHRGLSEYGPDVQYADAAHLEKILEHQWTAAFQRIGRDAIELDDVVGDKPVAARDELERELAFPDRRCAGDEHAHFEDVQEHSVQRGRFREHTRQVEPDHLG